MKKSFVSRNNDKDLQNWISQAPDIDAKDDHEMTPLMWAVKLGSSALVQAVLERGPQTDLQNLAGDTALHIAAKEGYVELAQMLLKSGANSSIPNDHGNTPLHYACFYRHRDLAFTLLEAGAILNGLNKNKKSALNFAGTRLSAELKGRVLEKGSSLQSVHLKARSTELIESEAKAKHLANTRKHLWDIGANNLQLLDVLYKTHTCDVYSAQLSGTSVMVKKYVIQRQVDQQEIEAFREAVKPLKTIYHRNLVSMLGIVSDPTFIAAIYDLSALTTTNLQQLLHNQDIVFKPVQILQYATDIVNALLHIYKNKMTYLNLKSRNVLVQRAGDSDRVAITDYGLHNTLLGNFNDGSDKLMEPEWIAPEVLKDGEFKDKEAAEVYSFAILFYEMVTRLYPYEGMNAMHIGLKVAMEGLRPEMPDYVPTALKDLIYICWKEEKSDRPTIGEIKEVLDELLEIEASA